MLNIKTISILAIAGTAVAAPQGWGKWAGNYFNGDGENRGNNNNNYAPATEVAVVTAYTTVTYDGKWNGGNWNRPAETPAPSPAPVVESPKPAAPEKSQPSPAPVASGSNDGYMGIVSTWRSNMGLAALSEDSKLVGNALKTAQDGNGQMVHQLNPGSMGQVLAPGGPGDFEKVFVGGWLCELPNASGMNGVCASMSKGWAYDGQTGHAEILRNGKYSKIGCANAGGIWSCDLA